MLNGIKTVIAVNRLDVRAIHYMPTIYLSIMSAFAILYLYIASLETCGFRSFYDISLLTSI